ncbi:MAG: SoxR reducing system RseC family protein [Deltaproteobacteria bacterium]|nr:SoxR reducing system RseC family protein [Deltaproteobacteria bacterium]
MIEEQGIVIEVKGKTAVIKAKRTDECEQCASKSVCKGENDDMFIEALNSENAKVGENVIFAVGAGTIIKAGVLVYLFPLIGFIIGIMLGQVFGKSIIPALNKDITSVIFGGIVMALTFLGVTYYSILAQKKDNYMPIIVKIID